MKMSITKFITSIIFIIYSSLSYSMSSIESATTYPIEKLSPENYFFDKNINYTITVLHKKNEVSKEDVVISKSFTYTKKNEIVELINKNDIGLFRTIKDPYKTMLLDELKSNKINEKDLTLVDKAYITGEYKEASKVNLRTTSYKESLEDIDYNNDMSSYLKMDIKVSLNEKSPRLNTIIKYTTLKNKEYVNKYFLVNFEDFYWNKKDKQTEKIPLNDHLILVIDVNVK